MEFHTAIQMSGLARDSLHACRPQTGAWPGVESWKLLTIRNRIGARTSAAATAKTTP